MTGPIIITGAPGAGKTTLAAQLGKALGWPVGGTPGGLADSMTIDTAKLKRHGCRTTREGRDDANVLLEHCAYGPDWSGPAASIVAVIDGVTGPPETDAHRSMLRAADLVVVTRGDLVDVSEARRIVATMTEAPVIAASFGKIDAAALQPGTPKHRILPGAVGMRHWSYAGAATFTQDLAERFLIDRPDSTTRLKGMLLGRDGGYEVDVAGRARSVTPCAAPAETQIFAAGIADDFDAVAVARHFAETVASGAARAGWLSYR
ncbi:MAG: hypothetical protein ACFB03_21935 [Paracoccaceae bacterium]